MALLHDALARRVRVGPVVALIGFADRSLVAEAKGAGASAVLDLPFDLADLAAALDRLPLPSPARPTRNEPGHPTPPRPASRASAAAKRLAEPGRGA